MNNNKGTRSAKRPPQSAEMLYEQTKAYQEKQDAVKREGVRAALTRQGINQAREADPRFGSIGIFGF